MKLFYRTTYILLLICLCHCGISVAQQIPIGSWSECLPYRNPVLVAESDNKVYCIGGGISSSPTAGVSLYSVNKSDLSIERYSKVTGLSDIGYSYIAFDKPHQILVIAYTNSNIDLMSANGVVNIPDLKVTNIVGDKNVYHIFINGDYAYLSCGFGIVVVDLVKNEIHDTYYIGPGGNPARVNAISGDGNYLYAATINGLYRAGINNPQLAYYASWTKMSSLVSSADSLPPGEVKNVISFQNKIYCTVNNAVYNYDTAWHKVYSQPNWVINNLSAGITDVLVNENEIINGGMVDSKIGLISGSGQLDSLRHPGYIIFPLSSVQESDGSIWEADFYSTLNHVKDSIASSSAPNGPAHIGVSSMAINNHNLYVASGGVTLWTYSYAREGFYARVDNNWNSYNVDTATDIFLAGVNPNTGNAYFGSFGGGLIEFNNSSVTNLYKKNNSSLTGQIGNSGAVLISGMAFDQDGNMWLSNFQSSKPLCMRTIDGKWYSFTPTSFTGNGQLTQIVIDQNNYKWIPLVNGAGSILVYDSGTDPTDPSDDRSVTLGIGVGKGNLPNPNIDCVAVDQEGQVWVGTDQGVAVFYCPSEVFDGGCDAQQILVKQDQYYNYLLVNEVINAIAVDGADRKWFATNDGVFLMSPDGTKEIYYFNVDNSPLFSNTVNSIAIDNLSGEVYFGTDQGIMVFRSGATQENNANCSPLVYPNPVKKDYNGPIAIKGLINDSQVKITDISGHLVYQTTALGTQAIWNGQTLKGTRASSGVYMVYATSPDGTQTCITKLVLIN